MFNNEVQIAVAPVIDKPKVNPSSL